MHGDSGSTDSGDGDTPPTLSPPPGCRPEGKEHAAVPAVAQITVAATGAAPAPGLCCLRRPPGRPLPRRRGAWSTCPVGHMPDRRRATWAWSSAGAPPRRCGRQVPGKRRAPCRPGCRRRCARLSSWTPPRPRQRPPPTAGTRRTTRAPSWPPVRAPVCGRGAAPRAKRSTPLATAPEDATGDGTAFYAYTAPDAGGGAPVRHLDTPKTRAAAAPNSRGEEENTYSLLASSEGSCSRPRGSDQEPDAAHGRERDEDRLTHAALAARGAEPDTVHNQEMDAAHNRERGGARLTHAALVAYGARLVPPPRPWRRRQRTQPATGRRSTLHATLDAGGSAPARHTRHLRDRGGGRPRQPRHADDTVFLSGWSLACDARESRTHPTAKAIKGGAVFLTEGCCFTPCGRSLRAGRGYLGQFNTNFDDFWCNFNYIKLLRTILENLGVWDRFKK
jgi:hypothetical protein